MGKYQRVGSACPASCSNPSAPQVCALPDTEVCTCPDGQLLEEDSCIEPSECGCIAMSGLRHEVGHVFVVIPKKIQWNKFNFIRESYSVIKH